MNSPTYIKELTDTIEKLAEQIQEGERPCQNINAAMHSINMELSLELCWRMEKKT